MTLTETAACTLGSVGGIATALIATTFWLERFWERFERKNRRKGRHRAGIGRSGEEQTPIGKQEDTHAPT